MAFGANTIGSGLTSGLTGNINKAYILMHQPDLNPTRKADSSGNFGLEGAAQLLQTGVSDKKGRNLGISGSGLNGLSVDSTLTAVANLADYIIGWIKNDVPMRVGRWCGAYASSIRMAE